MEKDIQRLANLFRGLSTAHGTHSEPYQEADSEKWQIKKGARTLREPVTLNLWKQHVKGKYPLGVICINEDNICFWGSIDIDIYDDDNIQDIVVKVKKSKFPLICCRSKSGGLHLFLFLKEGEPAGAVQSTLRDMAASLGLAGSEIFPKQSHILTERGDLGSWMVMPYFGSTYNGRLKEQVGLKDSGAEMSLTEFVRVAEAVALSHDEFKKMSVVRKKGNGKVEEPFKDGPPCMEHLSKAGFPQGTRNNALFHMGVYFRKKYPSNWDVELLSANQRFMNPPLGAEEIAGIVRSLNRKTYEYTCKIEPMCSHCDSSLCRVRKYGVGDEGNIPMITSLSKLDTNPVVWFMDISGARVEVTTEQLQNYYLVQRQLIETGATQIGHIKQATWIQMLSDALKDHVVIEAPEDIGLEGRFHEHLQDYLTNRQRGERKEDLISGYPWEDEDQRVHYFRLRNFVKFLNREDLRDEQGRRMTSIKASRLIQKLGGNTTHITVKDKQFRVWWVSSDIIDKIPDAEPTPVPGMPI